MKKHSPYLLAASLLISSPHSFAEDQYEENDNWTVAAPLPGFTTPPEYPPTFRAGSLEGESFDEDWFLLDVPYGVGALTVRIDETSTSSVYLEVLEGPGVPLEYLPAHSVNSHHASFDFLTPKGETHYIRIFNPGPSDPSLPLNYEGESYKLTWTMDMDDNYESNDNSFPSPGNDAPTKTFDLSAYDGKWLSEVDGKGRLFDADWYVIYPEEGTEKIIITSIHEGPEDAVFAPQISAYNPWPVGGPSGGVPYTVKNEGKKRVIEIENIIHYRYLIGINASPYPYQRLRALTYDLKWETAPIEPENSAECNGDSQLNVQDVICTINAVLE